MSCHLQLPSQYSFIQKIRKEVLFFFFLWSKKRLTTLSVEMVAGMGRRRIREEAIPQFVVAPDKQLLNEEKVARLFENDMEVEGFFFFCSHIFMFYTIVYHPSRQKDEHCWEFVLYNERLYFTSISYFSFSGSFQCSFGCLKKPQFLSLFLKFKYESAPTAIESHVFRQVSDRLTCHLSSPLSPMHSVCLMGLEFDIELIGDDIFQVVVTGMSVLLKKGVGRRKKGKKGEKEREREREEKDEDGGGKITPRKGDDGGFEGVDEVLNDGFMPSAEEMTEADKFLYGSFFPLFTFSLYLFSLLASSFFRPFKQSSNLVPFGVYSQFLHRRISGKDSF